MDIPRQVQGGVFSAQCPFLSSLPDAPSRNPPTLSSDGTTPHESETTGHPPDATWHHAPNAATNGGATATHAGNPVSCTGASETPGARLGVEGRVGVWSSGSRERREGASARPGWLCVPNDGRRLAGWAESPDPGDCLRGDPWEGHGPGQELSGACLACACPHLRSCVLSPWCP